MARCRGARGRPSRARPASAGLGQRRGWTRPGPEPHGRACKVKRADCDCMGWPGQLPAAAIWGH
eukprot:9485331-Pyramimonas_sp.AAC.1